MPEHVPEQHASSWKSLNAVIFALGAALSLAIAFWFGVQIGERKAMFAYRWGENYHHIFAGPPHGFFGNFDEPAPMDPHGVFGNVLKIDGNTLLIQNGNGTEESVVVSTSTMIRRDNSAISLNDVSSTDRVTVIGAPNGQGQIDAKFIRVFDQE